MTVVPVECPNGMQYGKKWIYFVYLSGRHVVMILVIIARVLGEMM